VCIGASLMVFWGIFLQLFRFVVHNTLVVLIVVVICIVVVVIAAVVALVVVVVVVAVAVRFKIYVCWL